MASEEYVSPPPLLFSNTHTFIFFFSHLSLPLFFFNLTLLFVYLFTRSFLYSICIQFVPITSSFKRLYNDQAFSKTCLSPLVTGIFDVYSENYKKRANVIWGTAVAQWLRCCATNRKVAGSIPAGVIGIFQ